MKISFGWHFCNISSRHLVGRFRGRMSYFHLKTTYHCSPIGFASSQSHNPTLCAKTFISLAFLSRYHCEKNSKRFFSSRNVYSNTCLKFLFQSSLVKLRLVHGVVNIITSFNRDGIGKIYIPARMKVRKKKKRKEKLIKYPTKIWFIPTWK